MLRIGKSMETESRLVVTKSWEEGTRGVTAKGSVFPPWVDENGLKLIVAAQSISIIKSLNYMLYL